jgi:hypothetical protein
MNRFGQDVRHTPGGVPEFCPHPIAESPDLSLLRPFDFHTTGQMPALIGLHQRMRELARSRWGDELHVTFPLFRRGPLDICIQLRGYERFVADTVERPEFVHAFLAHVAAERDRWMRQQRRFLREGEPDTPTCGIIVPIIADLLAALPRMRWLDVSGWNDFEALDRLVGPAIGFGLSFINSFVLAGSHAEHCDKLRRIAGVRRRRGVSLCAQAIVRLHDDFAQDLRRMNRFSELARKTLAE